MTTLAPPKLKAVASQIEALFPSAVFAGIVGDHAHALRGGYHISLEDQSANNYSAVRVDDKAPPGNWSRDMASALDISLSAKDMVTASRRVVAVWSNHADTRRRYINAVNGYLGSGNAQRWDFVTGGVDVASADHKWHTHSEIRRRYVNDDMAMKALLSMYGGETHDEWLTSIGKPTSKPPTSQKRDLVFPHTPMMYGDDVKEVQRRLRNNYRSYAGSLVVDGWYGAKTKAIVEEFQRRAGLAVDGIVGPKTRQRLGLAA